VDVSSLNGLDVKVINNKQNIGYAAALNQGAGVTSNPLILCLNADTRLQRESLWKLSGFLENNHGTGVVAPKLIYPDGGLQYSCRTAYTCGGILGRRLPIGLLPMLEPELRRHLMLDEDHSTTLYPDWVQGSCMMIPREVFECVGGFDERFFLYFEDYDFCTRIRDLGYTIAYEPSSTVIHHYARTSRNENALTREFWTHILSALKYFGRSKLGLPRFSERWTPEFEHLAKVDSQDMEEATTRWQDDARVRPS